MVITRTAPTAEPITVADAKAYLGIRAEDSQFDLRIERLIKAARARAERQARIAIPKQTVTIEWDTQEVSGGRLNLVPPPVISITSIKFYDVSASDFSAAIAPTEYQLVSEKTGLVREREGGWAGLIERDYRGLQTVHEAGYETVPDDVLQAVYIWFEIMFKREDESENAPLAAALLTGAQSLRATPI